MPRSITVIPESFELVPYSSEEIAEVLGVVADELDFASGEIELTIDEELFNPLTGMASDVTDGAVQLWISGANLEDKKRPRKFAPAQARPDFAAMLLRASDRLGGGFANAPSDSEVSRATRIAWDIWAIGRASRLGFDVRAQPWRYDFRLQHGFTDAADEAFEALWSAGDGAYTWETLDAVAAQTEAHRRPESRIPVDLLQQRATGRIVPR